MAAATRRAEEEELAMAAELEREALAKEAAAVDGTELSDSQLIKGASAGQSSELCGTEGERGLPLVDLSEDAPAGVPPVAMDQTAGGLDSGAAAVQGQLPLVAVDQIAGGLDSGAAGVLGLLDSIPQAPSAAEIPLPPDEDSQEEEQQKEIELWGDTEFVAFENVDRTCDSIEKAGKEALYVTDVEMGVGPRGAKRLSETSQPGAKQRAPSSGQ